MGSKGARLLIVTAAAALLLAGCGDATVPSAGEDGLVDATPRALASIVIDHVDPGEPRRTTGGWSDWNDPLAIDAQVDYGGDPEGTGGGETRTVRVEVREISSYGANEQAWLHCRPAYERGRCEEEDVDGATVLYRWYPGVEEEEAGGYSWIVVREDETVRVTYEGSGLFDEDPRGLDLGVQSEDLRTAALDPAMSLRTTPDAWEAGAALDNYVGVESAPEKPEYRPTTPRQLAAAVTDYGEVEPDAVRRSTLEDFGPDAVGAHLEFDAGKGYGPFTVDILTTVGRVRQIDPLPCPVQRSAEAAERGCFAWDADSAATWTLAKGDEPGVLWIIGAQDDDKFNRIESVGLRVESRGIVAPWFTDPDVGDNGLPPDWFGLVAPMTSDLSIGPETRVID